LKGFYNITRANVNSDIDLNHLIEVGFDFLVSKPCNIASPWYMFVGLGLLTNYLGSFNLVSVADPSLGGISHSSRYLFSFLD